MLLSVTIITFNNEKEIERCIKSVESVADEIIVIDGYSTDYTTGIAGFLGVKVTKHLFIDITAQKNFAAQQATHDWVLSVDANEVLSEELVLAIKVVKSQPHYGCYYLSCRNHYYGKWIKHGGYYPDKKICLFDKTKGKWRDNNKVAQWKPYNSNIPVGKLNGDLLRYSFANVKEHEHNIKERSKKTAKYSLGGYNRVSQIKMIANPILCFCRMYFLKLGILDGSAGYHLSRLSAYSLFLQYQQIRKNKN